MTDSCFVHANTAILVVDAQSGAVVLEDNALKTIYPASNTKLWSTSLALDLLGRNYVQFSRIYVNGLVGKDSTLHGDIVIDGNFNPCLGSGTIHKNGGREDFINKWVSVISKLGIKKIDGAVKSMESSIWKNRYSSWMLEDIPYPYGCAVSETGSYDNSFVVKATIPAINSDSSGIVSIYPSVPNSVFINHIKKDTSKKTEIDVNDETDLGQNPKFVLIGNIKKDKDTAKLELAQPSPALNTAFLLTKALENSKIKVSKPAQIIFEIPLSALKIDSIASLPIGELIKLTNLHSNNLFAELLLRISAKASGYADKDLGAFLIDYWSKKGIDTKGMVLADGSGISRMDAISPQQIVSLLKKMHESAEWETFFNSLPIAGVSGTLKHFGKGTAIENHLFAKTGSATGIQCYSGYIKANSGKLFIFSLLVNQFYGQRATMHHKLEGLFNQIINY